MRVLDLVIDRCENTVRYTGRTLLCWLSSPKLHIYRETPFCLMAKKSSETRYRVLQKRFIAFVIHLHTMSNALQREVANFRLNTMLSGLVRLRTRVRREQAVTMRMIVTQKGRIIMTVMGTRIQKITNLTIVTLRMAAIRPSSAKIPIQNYEFKRTDSSILRPSIIS
jgi:hypothetical protein